MKFCNSGNKTRPFSLLMLLCLLCTGCTGLGRDPWSLRNRTSGYTPEHENTTGRDNNPKIKDNLIPGIQEREPGTGRNNTFSGIPASSGLRAGFADDNKQFNYFLSFLKEYSFVDHYSFPISERIILKIKDKTGKSLAGAVVRIFNSASKLLCRGKSYTDGTFLFFPSEYGPETIYTARVEYGREVENIVIDRDGKRSLEVNFKITRPEYREVPLDILFIMDTTGSMGEEIERLRTTLEIINLNLMSLSSHPRVRFGMVLYKDRSPDEEYITQIIPLTGNLELFRSKLNQVYADGGGDYPEDLQSALEDSIRKIEWNPTAIKLSFIITDAPPHLDYGQEYTYLDSARAARREGIKIFSVGTGGLDVYGEYVLRQISQYTYAKYIFLTYGESGEKEGGEPGSVSHHTGSNFSTDKLETIIIRFAKEELSLLTDEPLLSEEEYFRAQRINTEDKNETLEKLFSLAVSQLVDYSSQNIPPGTRAGFSPLTTNDKAHLRDAEYFTAHLQQAIAGNRLFTVVERRNIQEILSELKIQQSGWIDQTTAVKIGAFQGAEVLIYGDLYIKKDSYELFLRLLRVETAEVLGVTKAIIARELGLSK